MASEVQSNTRMLVKGDRVWVIEGWLKGTVCGRSMRTERYMIEIDAFPGQRLCQKYIYRSRDELFKIGGG